LILELHLIKGVFGDVGKIEKKSQHAYTLLIN